jgi:hypothetical protein
MRAWAHGKWKQTRSEPGKTGGIHRGEIGRPHANDDDHCCESDCDSDCDCLKSWDARERAATMTTKTKTAVMPMTKAEKTRTKRCLLWVQLRALLVLKIESEAAIQSDNTFFTESTFNSMKLVATRTLQLGSNRTNQIRAAGGMRSNCAVGMAARVFGSRSDMIGRVSSRRRPRPSLLLRLMRLMVAATIILIVVSAVLIFVSISRFLNALATVCVIRRMAPR